MSSTSYYYTNDQNMANTGNIGSRYYSSIPEPPVTLTQSLPSQQSPPSSSQEDPNSTKLNLEHFRQNTKEYVTPSPSSLSESPWHEQIKPWIPVIVGAGVVIIVLFVMGIYVSKSKRSVSPPESLPTLGSSNYNTILNDLDYL
jgi:hypothetical protein